jgi:hypothetical protein
MSDTRHFSHLSDWTDADALDKLFAAGLDAQRVRAAATEMRAAALLRVLRHAVAGDPHWRLEARILIGECDDGVLREPRI